MVELVCVCVCVLRQRVCVCEASAGTHVAKEPLPKVLRQVSGGRGTLLVSSPMRRDPRASVCILGQKVVSLSLVRGAGRAQSEERSEEERRGENNRC
jgi:hypothetical protein